MSTKDDLDTTDPIEAQQDDGGDCSRTACCASLRDFACSVCGAPPDNDGMIEHGSGCYTQNPSGGGASYVDLPSGLTGQAIHDPTPIYKLINHLNRKCVEAAKAGDMIKAKRIAELAGKVEEARSEVWHNAEVARESGEKRS